jgi:hypothetical protein
LVVADRLIAPFELSKQSKLIIGQLHHQSLRWLRPKVAHLSTAGDCCAAGFQHTPSQCPLCLPKRTYTLLPRYVRFVP